MPGVFFLQGLKEIPVFSIPSQGVWGCFSHIETTELLKWLGMTHFSTSNEVLAIEITLAGTIGAASPIRGSRETCSKMSLRPSEELKDCWENKNRINLKGEEKAEIQIPPY